MLQTFDFAGCMFIFLLFVVHLLFISLFFLCLTFFIQNCQDFYFFRLDSRALYFFIQSCLFAIFLFKVIELATSLFETEEQAIFWLKSIRFDTFSIETLELDFFLLKSESHFSKKLVLSFSRKQTIHILPNISRRKWNQTMKFGQLIEYNVWKKSCRKRDREINSRLLFVLMFLWSKIKWSAA